MALSRAECREAMEKHVEACRNENRTPTVASFAAAINVKRPTLYLNYRDVVAELIAKKAGSGSAAAGRPRDEVLIQLKAKVHEQARETRVLREELRIYADENRRLTIENAHLRSTLERQANIPSIAPGLREQNQQ
jgi:hypothetical protein